MSYAAEELRESILELFDDAAAMSRHRAAYGELTLVVKPRRHRHHRTQGKRAYEKRVRDTVRAIRVAERAAHQAARVAPRLLAATTARSFYRCEACHSTASTHRCPG